MGRGAFWAFSVFGLTAHSGLRPGSDGRYQTLHEGNYAPYNFLTIFSDGFNAIWLLLLLYLCHRWGGMHQQV
jgi:hypothetical protein